MNKIIVYLMLFLIIIAGGLGFWFYRERVFSKEVLKIDILSKDLAKTGEEIEYTVKYKNNGNFVLEQPRLVFEFPESSLTEGGKTRITQELKDIYPGDEEFLKFKGRLLGKEGDLKVAKASISYIPKNLSARYETDTTFTAKIETTPITLDFDLPSKAEKGKEIQYSVNYFSNVDYPFENLSVKIEAVNGFDFEESNPPSLDKSEWKIQKLNKAEGGRIVVKGKIIGETRSRLNFKAKIGVWLDDEFIVIKEAEKEVEVIEPQLFISQIINGSLNYTASPGERLHYEIFFRNIGPTPFENLFLMAKIEGSAVDFSSIRASYAQIRPDSRLIVFDPKQVSILRRLDVQEEKKVEFDLKLKDDWTPSYSEKNSTSIKSNISVSQISQEFLTKVNSKLEISQKGYYQNSPIVNSGPTPPEAGQPTSYTITWNIKNYFNDVKNAKARAFLPENATLTGKVFPESEFSNFSFDSATREILWSAGDIAAGAGISSASPSISFQVSIVPSFSQKGFSAQIIGDVLATGEDQFTGSVITGEGPLINTSLPDDSAFGGTVR
ncbi:MAG: hypothetical protein HYT36_02350 [Candidatus Staskawiczbacteria bacterium]|nr:hypothetical protein [Candidatus Staskawiczbacteria bacterium]